MSLSVTDGKSGGDMPGMVGKASTFYACPSNAKGLLIMICVTGDFESGNINLLDAQRPDAIRLAIKADGAAEFHQWFFFCVHGAKGTALRMIIENAGTSSYPSGWPDYRACHSSDKESDHWKRVPTRYEDGALIIEHTPQADTAYYAYFAPFTPAQNTAMIARSAQRLAAVWPGQYSHDVPGHSLDGYPIDIFRLGTVAPGKLQLWVIARQHPGESMGSWFMDGLLSRLADATDASVGRLLSEAVLHIVPMMNPDGVARGHLRTNAAGMDLNRAWQNASPEMSPEVFVVRKRMHETGVDFFLDVHGDEGIANNFLVSARGIAGWNDRLEALFNSFSALLLEESSDFQTREGYPVPQPGKANHDIATNAVAQHWDCFSATLEMPFKDAAIRTDRVGGWSPERCRNFAHAHLRAMARFLDVLHVKG
jgi:murein tripeptide amidase MpaA